MPGAPVHRTSFSASRRRAERRRHGVGVDVEEHAARVGRERTDDGHEAVIEQLADHGGVDAIDVADEAVIDGLTAVPERHGGAPMAAHESGIDPADADGIDVEIAADREDARVDEAVQHHRGHIDRALVGDASALDHARGDAEGVGKLGELRTPAVDQHDAHAEVVQDADLLDEGARGRGVAEHAAACLHHEDLALVHAYVRRSALQRPDRERLVSPMHDHPDSPLSSR
jgi:hypothetical protein